MTDAQPHLLRRVAVVRFAPAGDHQDRRDCGRRRRRRLRQGQGDGGRDGSQACAHYEPATVDHHATAPSVSAAPCRASDDSRNAAVVAQRPRADAAIAAAASVSPAPMAVSWACSKARSVGRFSRLIRDSSKALRASPPLPAPSSTPAAEVAISGRR